jgi:hypothetical protein
MFLRAILFAVQDALHLHGYMDIVKIHGYKDKFSKIKKRYKDGVSL